MSSKTDLTLFTNSMSSGNILITIKISHIERIYLTKKNIDQNLTWKHHVSYVLNKLSKRTAILCRVQHLLRREALYK